MVEPSQEYLEALRRAAEDPLAEIVEQTFAVVVTTGTPWRATLSTTRRHQNVDVFASSSGVNIAANPVQIFGKVKSQEELISTGKFNVNSTVTGDVGSNLSQRVCSVRSYAAEVFRVLFNGVKRAGGSTSGQVTITMIAYDRGETIDRTGTWWPPLNVQGGANALLMNWDCPLPSPAYLSSLFAFDNRTTGANDFLMFFDAAITTNAPPANGSAPVPGLVFPLASRQSLLSVDESNRDRRFFKGITWALSTTGDTLTLDTAVAAIARVDVETR